MTGKDLEDYTPYERELHDITGRERVKAQHWIGSAADVLAIAKLVKLWFDDHAPNATAADIVAMTKLIMDLDRHSQHDVEVTAATEELDSEY